MLKNQLGFTLIELLVVIAIVAILAALLFPVFSRAKASAKASDCLAKSSQLQKAIALYVADSDGRYPQSRKTSSAPWLDDAEGALEEPDFGSVFPRLNAYLGAKYLEMACQEDPDPLGKICESINPDVPELNSFLYNGSFAFGLNESDIERSSQTILFSERRSRSVDGAEPFCNYLYRPWFNQANSTAPEDDMDGTVGAVDTVRHNGRSNFSFTDGHLKSMAWSQTFSLPNRINLHTTN